MCVLAVPGFDFQYGVRLDDVPIILLYFRICFFVSMEFQLCSTVYILTLENIPVVSLTLYVAGRVSVFYDIFCKIRMAGIMTESLHVIVVPGGGA